MMNIDIGNMVHVNSMDLRICLNILIILFIHFVADFMMQTDDMARGKSKNNKDLTDHILLYMLPFAIFVNPLYAVINGAMHWVTDYYTSRKASKLWEQGRVHDFFVIVGLDQFIHAFTLIMTYYWVVL